MDIAGRTALVTGANRGLGRHLAEQLRDRGASTVYAAARRPESVVSDGVVPIALELTDSASITAAAEATDDVSILINCGGSGTRASLLTGDIDDIRLEFETHFFGTMQVTRAFAAQLGAHAESSVVNVLSTLAWISFNPIGGYCAAKSAEWSLTNALRQDLAPQGTRVTALHVGYMDTERIATLDVPKSDPADIARITLDGIEAGEFEILADESATRVRAGLAGGVAALYPNLTVAASVQ
jgi:NAD(P)-dependent dehydrogenase (short-subunit alcohol dehydrogenase family)